MLQDTDNTDFIKDKTIEFCQDQALKNAIFDAVGLYQSGKRIEVRHLIDNALKVGFDLAIIGDDDLGDDGDGEQIFEDLSNSTVTLVDAPDW